MRTSVFATLALGTLTLALSLVPPAKADLPPIPPKGVKTLSVTTTSPYTVTCGRPPTTNATLTNTGTAEARGVLILNGGGTGTNYAVAAGTSLTYPVAGLPLDCAKAPNIKLAVVGSQPIIGTIIDHVLQAASMEMPAANILTAAGKISLFIGSGKIFCDGPTTANVKLSGGSSGATADVTLTLGSTTVTVTAREGSLVTGALGTLDCASPVIVSYSTGSASGRIIPSTISYR